MDSVKGYLAPLGRLLMSSLFIWAGYHKLMNPGGTAQAFDPTDPAVAAADGIVRERATTAREFDPEEIARGGRAAALPPFVLAALPLVTVVSVNLFMSFGVLPKIDASFLDEEHWGATSLAA